jgi:hypothetical protein
MFKQVSITSQISRLEKLGFLQESGLSTQLVQKRFGHESVETGSGAVVKVLVLSPTQVSLTKQLELAGIARLDIDTHQMTHCWTPSQDMYIATIRIDDERMAVNSLLQPEEREFHRGERGATIAEAIHLFVQYPDLLNRHLFDCHGTLYGEEGGHIPILYLWNGHPEVGEYCPGIYCQMATMGGPTLRVLDPVPAEINLGEINSVHSDHEKFSPEAFSSLREQQVQQLCSSGFPSRMGLGEEELAAQVPVLSPMVLNSLKKDENLLLVVPENLVEPMEQMRLASLQILIDPSQKKEDNLSPNHPYWIGWRLLGNETAGNSKCIYDPHPPERPLSLVEGIHLAIQYPELLEDLVVTLTSTSLSKGHTMILCHWRGKPQISVICRPAANRYAAMGGRAIVVHELSEERIL